MKEKDRIYGIDIIRIIAVILVLGVHFFSNTKYFSAISQGGIEIKIQGMIRHFCMICVPLFMTITGFLNKSCEYNKSFFKKLFNILIIWLFYSLIEYFVLNTINGKITNFNLKDLIFSITSFSACGYSWYIEMYIGLYLFSPLLNNAYNSFNKKNKKYLIIIMLISIIIPTFLNSGFLFGIHLPNWWVKAYPLVYYLCGKFIADTNPKINKVVLVLIFILTQIGTYYYGNISYIEYYNLTIFISTIIVFLLFYDIKIVSPLFRTIIKYISSITLDIYLGSSLIDKILYPIFNKQLIEMGLSQHQILIYMPSILGVVFILALIYGSIRKFIIRVR